MRMRKKKHTDDRIASCGKYLVEEPSLMKGKWNELSGDKKLCLEIGCGKGTFVCETAKRNPDKFFVAVEKVRDVIVMAMEKAKNAGLDNVVFADMDAEKLCDVFEENELSEIYLNFSDPWPKKKHAKRRLTYRSFLDIYRTILCDDGVVYFKTDNRPLFDFSLVEMERSAYALSDITYDLHNSEYAKDNVVTEYEANFSAKGFSINRVVAKAAPSFAKITENVYRLWVPFMGVFTSVFCIKSDNATIVFDAATTQNDVEKYIVPALKNGGFVPTHIISSHYHEDHMGGEEFLAKVYPEAVRMKMPHNGTVGEGKKALADGEMIDGTVKVVSLPGHSDDAIGLFDTRTKTLVSADCLQLYGIGIYGTGVGDGSAYLNSVRKARALDPETVVAAHDYAPLGCIAVGKEAAGEYIDECEKYIYVLKNFANAHRDLSFEEIALRYREENKTLPLVGAQTFEAFSKIEEDEKID